MRNRSTFVVAGLAAIALALAVTACGGTAAHTATSGEATPTEQTTTNLPGMTHKEAAQLAGELNDYIAKYHDELVTIRDYPSDDAPKPPSTFKPGEKITADQVLAADPSIWGKQISADDAAGIIVFLGPLFTSHGHDPMTWVADTNRLNAHGLAALAS
jgi:hypothetical protein